MRLPGSRRTRRAASGAIAVLAVAGVLLAHGITPARAARTDVRIAAASPSGLDPAAQADIASAAISAQLFESLTAFDANLILRPALAAGWDIAADGRQIVFHLRPNLKFSDGSALTGDDVVRSWLRVLDPAHPSPLASLMLDVTGARDYVTAKTRDPASVGVHASGSDVTVDLDRAGADFPSIVASATFAVVPRFACSSTELEAGLGQCGISSGGYVLSAITKTELTLTANGSYWAGTPAIQTVHLITDIAGKSPVDVFSAGDLDYAPIASNDASWIRFDSTLGPVLRTVPSLSLTYLGFDTTRKPFDDVRVRQAIGKAVDWTRIVRLTAGTNTDVAATSMVPAGIPGRDSASWLPVHDPVAARKLLADAGFPGGTGFPAVTLSNAGSVGSGIVADLKNELGITVRLETYDDYFTRLATDPPAMWTLSWIADYPGPNDFLGVLLGTGAGSNYTGWTSPTFDAAITDAQSAHDPAAASAAFGRALGIVQTEVPVVPLAYPGQSWALSRGGLLGAGVNALGIPRYAGLAWAP
jgi:ABC-type oligopeptide transport system substrate-binding subunit